MSGRVTTLSTTLCIKELTAILESTVAPTSTCSRLLFKQSLRKADDDRGGRLKQTREFYITIGKDIWTKRAELVAERVDAEQRYYLTQPHLFDLHSPLF
jgi:hypothetical protein